MAEFIATILICGVLAVYGAFRYFKAENTDFKAWSDRASVFSGKISSLEDSKSDFENRFNALGNKIAVLELKAEKLQSELNTAIFTQGRMQAKLDKKKQVLTIRNAIPVTVVERDSLPPVPKVPTSEPVKALRKTLQR